MFTILRPEQLPLLADYAAASLKGLVASGPQD
jgi:hypothetical protein